MLKKLVVLLAFLCAWTFTAYGQVPVSLSPVARQTFFSASGAPLAGGFVQTFAAGTTTPLATFTDAGGLFPQSNPIILDGTGSATIWVTSAAYKFCVQNSSSVTQYCVDNITASILTSGPNTWGFLQTFSGGITVTGAANLSNGGSINGVFSGNPLLSQVWTFNGGITGVGNTGALTPGPGITNAPTFTSAVLTGTTGIGTGSPTTFSDAGLLTKYAGNVVTGVTLQAINGVEVSACAGGTVTVLTPIPANATGYRFSYNIFTLTAGSGGTATIKVAWVDASGTTQNGTSSTIDLTSPGSVQQGTVILDPAPGNVTGIKVTYAAPGLSGGPTCGGHWHLEQF